MADICPKTGMAFEQVSESLPKLVAEATPAELAPQDVGAVELRTVRVDKLDPKIVWRVIDMLKTL